MRGFTLNSMFSDEFASARDLYLPLLRDVISSANHDIIDFIRTNQSGARQQVCGRRHFASFSLMYLQRLPTVHHFHANAFPFSQIFREKTPPKVTECDDFKYEYKSIHTHHKTHIMTGERVREILFQEIFSPFHFQTKRCKLVNCNESEFSMQSLVEILKFMMQRIFHEIGAYFALSVWRLPLRMRKKLVRFFEGKCGRLFDVETLQQQEKTTPHGCSLCFNNIFRQMKKKSRSHISTNFMYMFAVNYADYVCIFFLLWLFAPLSSSFNK